jgi:hypothetical protein
MIAALHTSLGWLCARRRKGKVAPAIIERLRGATALHTTTHRRPQTSVRAGPFDYRLSHMRPRGRLRGEGKGRGGLQCTAVAGDLDVTDTDPTRASRQRGGPQLTHVEKDRGRSKRKMLALKSRATGFPFSSPTSQREAGAHRPAPPLGHINPVVFKRTQLQRAQVPPVAQLLAPRVAFGDDGLAVWSPAPRYPPCHRSSKRLLPAAGVDSADSP